MDLTVQLARKLACKSIIYKRAREAEFGIRLLNKLVLGNIESWILIRRQDIVPLCIRNSEPQKRSSDLCLAFASSAAFHLQAPFELPASQPSWEASTGQLGSQVGDIFSEEPPEHVLLFYVQAR